MTPQEIATAIASGDQEQIKSAQRFLKGLGKYEGPIDGDPGAGTLGAIKAYRDEVAARQQEELRAQELAVRQQEAAAEEARSDPAAKLTTFAVDALPAAGGYLLGSRFGKGTAESLDKAEKRRAVGARALAREPGLDPVEADRTARRRGYYGGPRRSGLRQYAVPGALVGLGYYTREELAPTYEDPLSQGALQAVGTAEMATGAGMMAKQLLGDARRDNLVDPRDQAALRSRAAEARSQRPGILSRYAGQSQIPDGRAQPPARSPALPPGQPPPAQPPAQPSMERPDLQRERPGQTRGGYRPGSASPERSLGSRFTKYGLPFAAGALTYDAVTGDAAANDGEVTMGDRALGAGAGVGAAGLTAGAMRLMNNPVAQRAVAGVAPGMAVADLNRTLAEGGSDPMAQAGNLASSIYESFAQPIRRAPDDFEAALQEFMEIMGEMGTHGNQIPRRPGPQL